MPGLEFFLVSRFMVFTLVLGRVSALMLAAPIFSSLPLPRQAKAFFAVGIALVVTPLYLNTSLPPVSNLATYGRLMLNEVLVGLLLGFGVAILFSGVQVAGQIASQLSGISLADVFNPAFDESNSAFTQLFYYLTMAVFVAIGGHRLMIEGLLDTFAWSPPGHAALGDSFVTTLADLLTQSFSLGIRSVAPLLVALSLATLFMGLVSRTVPQLNIIAIGFSVNSLLMLGLTALTLGSIAWTFQEPVVDAIHQLQSCLEY
jgi:flagellar biosynthetic protein FliR